MPRLNYVPSNRTLQLAWATAGVAAMLVFAGLTYIAVANTFQLRDTNERLDQSQAERDRLMERVQHDGVLLSFLDEGPTGKDLTYRCRVKVRDQAYICRPEPKP